MRNSRADQADNRRAELLEATRRIVLERGLANTRVADIAKAVNVSGGLIHYHFATKDELITAMLRATLDIENAALDEVVNAPTAAVARLDRVLHYYIPESRSDQSWLLWLDVWNTALREPAVREIASQVEQTWLYALERVIRDGVAAEEFVCPDPAGAAERIDAMLDGLVIRYTLHPNVLSQERLLEHARMAAAREVGVDPEALSQAGSAASR
ncbi:TetR/AcrR family transcriptional regulator [Nonomuraea soli]|uniref:AcrR family transcriptional regulator n=1 Tax=Nonomuraea soli TaxID=1032476 RepID=A0A7W0HT75_9ACTN|nr:TetR/AcrR family transcriptional regulator [Nonomuraea soli]MBA2894818.1 AcrR family transcriptional regulator [Nonomuraea soli]